jgi:hypothetical protein
MPAIRFSPTTSPSDASSTSKPEPTRKPLEPKSELEGQDDNVNNTDRTSADPADPSTGRAFIHQATTREAIRMDPTNEISYRVPFISDSSLAAGFHVSAALGGGAPHAFLVDTGSVGIVVPRGSLGPDYQDFDPSRDIEFEYVSSDNKYLGQWVKVPVILGVPAVWDGGGDYPIAHVEVFAVDRAFTDDQPVIFDGGVLGIGFAIGGLADGGPTRNPLLHLTFQGMRLSRGYIVSTGGIEVGLTPQNTRGFAFISLYRNASGEDWMQPFGGVGLTGDFSPDGFSIDLPILVDTGIDDMILWVDPNSSPPNLPSNATFPPGIAVSVSAPPADSGVEPALQYSFITGPTAPSEVEWRDGNGINTGRSVLAGADYLYDAAKGRIGFRTPPK